MATKKTSEQHAATENAPNKGKAKPQPAASEIYETTSTDAGSDANTSGEESVGFGRLMSEYGNNLRSLATQYYERLTESAEHLSASAQKLRESSNQLAHDYPGSMLGSAFVVGILVGFLTYRS